jgi:hypothetical protein
MTVDRFSPLKKGIESFHDLSFAHGGRGCKAPIRDRGFGSAPRVLSVIPVSPADDPSKGNEISLFYMLVYLDQLLRCRYRDAEFLTAEGSFGMRCGSFGCRDVSVRMSNLYGHLQR